MKPRDYFRSLNADQKRNYAARVETNVRYMYSTLFTGKGPRKKIRHDMISRVAFESRGNVSIDESIDYFLAIPCKKVAVELGYKLVKPIPSDTAQAA